MLAIVPVKGLDGAKTRLASLLSPEERGRLVLRMLDQVLAACAGCTAVERTLLVTPEPALAPSGVDVLVDGGGGHAAAVSAALDDERAAAGAVVVMADCPLVTSASLERLIDAARPVALVRAEDGGVNALALRMPIPFAPAFGVAGGATRTIERARRAGTEPALLVDPLLAFDVDRPSDLERLHGSIFSRAKATT